MSYRLILTIFYSFIILAGETRIKNKFSYNDSIITQDDFFEAKPVDLDASIAVGSSCGEIDFASNAKAGFENALETIKSKEFMETAMKAAPLLLACSFDDAVCAAIQSINQTASFFASFKLKQCELIDKYTNEKANIYREQMSGCMAKERAEGNDENQAQANCYKTLTDRLASIAENAEFVKKIDVLSDTYKWLGKDLEGPEKDNLNGAVGEETIKTGKVRINYGNEDNRPRTYFNLAQEGIMHMRKSFCDDQIKNRYIDIHEYLNFRDQLYITKLRHIYTGKSFVKMSTISKNHAVDICYKFIDSGIKSAYLIEINKRKSELSYALRYNPNNTLQVKEKLKKSIEQLDQDYQFMKNSISMLPNEIELVIDKSHEVTTMLNRINNDKENESIQTKNEISQDCVYKAECN